ncbi:MAG: DMT family transporter [Anaerolineae bacterium]
MKGADARTGYALAFLAAALWATLGVFGKLLYRYPVDPITIVTLRAIIASLTLGCILALCRPDWLRIARGDLPFFALYGVVGVALNYACYFLALKFTTVTTAVVLLYTYPALVVLGAMLFFKEPVSQTKLLALSMALVGCFLVAQGYDTSAIRINLPGVLFSLGAAATMAGYSLLGKRGVKRYPGWTLVFYAIGFGAIALTLWRGTGLISALSYPWQAWALIVGLAWGPTLLAYSLFTLALHYIEAGRASIVATLEPLLAAGLACGLLGERMVGPQWAGAALILGGVVVLQRG